MKIGKSHVFVLAVALIIIYAAFVSGSGGYCSAREFFSGRHDEEDDACIAKLIKRADDGNSFTESRLRYPTMEYIKRVCEKGVESLGERERFYFERYSKDRCSAWGFKTPKSKDGEANTTSSDTNATDGEGNLTRKGTNTIRNEAGAIKRDINSTGGLDAGQ
ncbi:hypothetical protein [uncultured Campylobacter sp.]|uniref:hypothetical protein n=1 Tax=uncultured Campylobacter sp. TaxID=218934 RepID=UPI00262D8790|nr:hypothetical protein [uncultured Campylobacter sp.]